MQKQSFSVNASNRHGVRLMLQNVKNRQKGWKRGKICRYELAERNLLPAVSGLTKNYIPKLCISKRIYNLNKERKVRSNYL